MPAHQLAASLPSRELALYQQYAIKRMLPGRRMEMHMAQICSVLAQVNGNKDVGTMDFLFDPEDDSIPDLEATKEFFGFNPRT
jgi:hypothetical protein